MDSIALERIAFQIKSPLATKTIAACQAAIDALKATRTEENGKVVLANGTRIRQATKILEKTLSPELVKICKDEMNLNLEVLIFTNCYLLQAATYTQYKAYNETVGGWDTVRLGYEIFSGTKDYNPDEFNVDYFKPIADNFDLDTGKLKTYTTEHITTLMLFTSTFMSEEIIDPKKFSPVTAEEMAAVILHEYGHAQTIIEHMSDLYHRAEVATNTVKYLNEKADDKTLTEAVNNINSQDKAGEQNLEKATTMLDKIKGRISNFAPVVAIIFGFYTFLFLLGTIRERLQLAARFGKINSTHRKTSDTVVTESNESYMERIADEFVSRHGLGAAMVSVLARITKYYESGNTYDNFSDAVKALGLIKATLMSYHVILSVVGGIFHVDDGTYDPDWLRFEHVLANMLVVFKNEDLDSESREYFLKETKNLIEIIDKFKARKSFKIKQLLWGTIFRILSRTSLSDSFQTAGLSADYDTLQLMTNGLIKNRLLYQAARLKNL